MKQIKVTLYLTVEDFQEEALIQNDVENGEGATAERYAKQVAEVANENCPYGVEVIGYKGENFNINNFKK